MNVESELYALLDAIIATDTFREIDAGCDGDGPVQRCYRALGQDVPEEITEWLREDEEKFDADVWDHEGNIVASLCAATADEIEEFKEQYADDPTKTVVVSD